MGDKDKTIQDLNKTIDKLTVKLLEKEAECQRCRKEFIKECRKKKRMTI